MNSFCIIIESPVSPHLYLTHAALMDEFFTLFLLHGWLQFTLNGTTMYTTCWEVPASPVPMKAQADTVVNGITTRWLKVIVTCSSDFIH